MLGILHFKNIIRYNIMSKMNLIKKTVIFLLMFTLLSSMTAFAEANNITESTYEPLHYLNDNTSLSIAIPSNNTWKTEITASEINPEWNDSDIFSVVNFNNADMSFDNNNVLTMTFNNVDYSITKQKTNIQHCRLIFQKQAYLLFNLKSSATEL